MSFCLEWLDCCLQLIHPEGASPLSQCLDIMYMLVYVCLMFGKTGAGVENATSMQKGPALTKNHTQDFL